MLNHLRCTSISKNPSIAPVGKNISANGIEKTESGIFVPERNTANAHITRVNMIEVSITGNTTRITEKKRLSKQQSETRGFERH